MGALYVSVFCSLYWKHLSFEQNWAKNGRKTGKFLIVVLIVVMCACAQHISMYSRYTDCEEKLLELVKKNCG